MKLVPQAGVRPALALFGTGCLSLFAGCVSVGAALLPGSNWRSSDPNPTAPLVESVPPENVPVVETRARERIAEPVAAPTPSGATLSAASLLGALLGGAGPLLGIYGTFEENLLDPDAPPPPAEPHAIQ